MIHEAQSRRTGGPQGPGHRKMDVQKEATTAKRKGEWERESYGLRLERKITAAAPRARKVRRSRATGDHSSVAMAAGKHLQRYDYDTAKDRKGTTAAAAAATMANGIIVATATHATVSLACMYGERW
ncbi:hypothetical protein CKAH01_01570 [Colletotrichum kahawae]|uniref:Uncharacterized protein n=1 Tax=Colletotrichum kahawae TaxID=34407 RepID=A0AAD9Y8G6_COLKA|nr:hypothetical protein CKAH01_01570 [Colletotrichum kahawae]